MAPPNELGRGPSASGWRKGGQTTDSNIQGNEPAYEAAGRFLLNVTNVATSAIVYQRERPGLAHAAGQGPRGGPDAAGGGGGGLPPHGMAARRGIAPVSIGEVEDRVLEMKG